LIAAMKVRSIPDDFSKLGTEDLRAIAISKEAALDLIRAGLAKESFIPVEYLDESTPSYLVAANSVSHGCHSLILRGWLAEREEKWEAAPQYYAGAVECAEHFARGGNSYIRFVATDPANWALERLLHLRGSLSSEAGAAIALKVEAIELKKESWMHDSGVGQIRKAQRASTFTSSAARHPTAIFEALPVSAQQDSGNAREGHGGSATPRVAGSMLVCL
jgi:hypothetical protein